MGQTHIFTVGKEYSNLKPGMIIKQFVGITPSLNGISKNKHYRTIKVVSVISPTAIVGEIIDKASVEVDKNGRPAEYVLIDDFDDLKDYIYTLEYRLFILETSTVTFRLKKFIRRIRRFINKLFHKPDTTYDESLIESPYKLHENYINHNNLI